jgi:hypothetical protein
MHIVHFSFTIDNGSGGLRFELCVEKRATMYIVRSLIKLEACEPCNFRKWM